MDAHTQKHHLYREKECSRGWVGGWKALQSAIKVARQAPLFLFSWRFFTACTGQEHARPPVHREVLQSFGSEGRAGATGSGVVVELTGELLANVPVALEGLLCRVVVSVLEVGPQGIEDATR